MKHALVALALVAASVSPAWAQEEAFSLTDQEQQIQDTPGCPIEPSLAARRNALRAEPGIAKQTAYFYVNMVALKYYAKGCDAQSRDLALFVSTATAAAPSDRQSARDILLASVGLSVSRAR